MTKIQSVIYKFVREFIRDNDYAPSEKEIGEAVEMRQADVHRILKKLDERGYIRKGKGWRNIELLDLARVRKAPVSRVA